MDSSPLWTVSSLKRPSLQKMEIMVSVIRLNCAQPALGYHTPIFNYLSALNFQNKLRRSVLHIGFIIFFDVFRSWIQPTVHTTPFQFLKYSKKIERCLNTFLDTFRFLFNPLSPVTLTTRPNKGGIIFVVVKSLSQRIRNFFSKCPIFCR